MGRNQVYRCQPGRSAWSKVSDYKFCLSPGTLVYGEIVDELIGEGRSQLKLPALHILDVIAIGYENISEKHYNER
jgi:cap1 methyltransferase